MLLRFGSFRFRNINATLAYGFSTGALSSKHLKHLVYRSGRQPCANCHGTYSIHPGVPLRTCLKVRSGTEIVEVRIHGLALVESVDHILGTVAIAPVTHVDVLLIVGLKRNAHIELKHAVAPEQQPVASTVEDAALKLRTFEGAARHASNPAPPVRRFSKVEWRRYFKSDLEQQLCPDLSHGASSRRSHPTTQPTPSSAVAARPRSG